MSDSVRPHRRQPIRLPRPWDSPGKNTGVGCHFLLQCMKVKSESEVAQSCPTLSDPMDCSPLGSSVHGTLQARVLEWGVIALSGMHIRSSVTTWNKVVLKGHLIHSGFWLSKKFENIYSLTLKREENLNLIHEGKGKEEWHGLLR